MNYYKKIEATVSSLLEDKVTNFAVLITKNHKHISEEDIYKLSNEYLSTSFKTDKKCKECSKPPSDESVTGNYCDSHLNVEKETMCEDSSEGESEEE